jgi:hypothetical protein
LNLARRTDDAGLVELLALLVVFLVVFALAADLTLLSELR